MDICEENSNLDFVVEDAIQDLLRFRVNKEAGLPWNVCKNCFEKLADFRLFKLRCIECKFTFESRLYEEHLPWKPSHELQDRSEDAIPSSSSATGPKEVAGDDARGAEHCNGPGDQGDWSISIVKEEELSDGVETAEEHPGGKEHVSAEGKEEHPLSQMQESALMGEGTSSKVKDAMSRVGSSESGRSPYHIGWPESDIKGERTEFGMGANEVDDSREDSVPPGMFEDRNAIHGEEQVNTEEAEDVNSLVETSMLNSSGATHSSSVGIDVNDSSNRNCYQFWPPNVNPPSNEEYDREEAGGSGDIDCPEEEMDTVRERMFSTELFGNTLEDDEGKPGVLTSDASTSSKNPPDTNAGQSGEPIGSNLTKNFSCRMCGRSFTSVFSQNRHMKSIHGIDLVPKKVVHKAQAPQSAAVRAPGDFSCHECGKVFPNNRRLRRHLVIHRKDKKCHECNICQKTFSRPENLRFHLKTVHLKEKDFVCTLCGWEFSHKGHFNTHMRIHNGQKQHACSVCGWRFSSRTGLRNHFVVHARRFQSPRQNP